MIGVPCISPCTPENPLVSWSSCACCLLLLPLLQAQDLPFLFYPWTLPNFHAQSSLLVVLLSERSNTQHQHSLTRCIWFPFSQATPVMHHSCQKSNLTFSWVTHCSWSNALEWANRWAVRNVSFQLKLLDASGLRADMHAYIDGHPKIIIRWRAISRNMPTVGVCLDVILSWKLWDTDECAKPVGATPAFFFIRTLLQSTLFYCMIFVLSIWQHIWTFSRCSSWICFSLHLLLSRRLSRCRIQHLDHKQRRLRELCASMLETAFYPFVPLPAPGYW